MKWIQTVAMLSLLSLTVQAAPDAVEGELLAKLVNAPEAYPSGNGWALPIPKGPTFLAGATETGYRIFAQHRVLLAIVTREPLGLRVELRGGKSQFLERPDAQETVSMPDSYVRGVKHVIRKADGQLIGYETTRYLTATENVDHMHSVRDGKAP